MKMIEDKDLICNETLLCIALYVLFKTVFFFKINMRSHPVIYKDV